MKRLTVLALGLWAGCGGGGDAPADASIGNDADLSGVDAAADATVAIVLAEPAKALPVLLTPCATGWSTLTAAGPSSCEPWPASPVAPLCPPGQERFPGDARCRTLGLACASDGFAMDLPTTGTIVHVKAGASGGTGSRAAPLGRIADALASATPGTIIALAAGSYAESVTLPPMVTLWGGCAEGTTIAPSDSSGQPIVLVQGPGAALRNLTVNGLRPGISVRGALAALTLTRVIVANVTGWGIEVTGGSVVAQELSVRLIQRAADGNSTGIWVASGGRLTATRLRIARADSTGLSLAGAGTTATVTDAVFSDLGASDYASVAIWMVDNASLQLTRALVERAYYWAFEGNDSSATLREVVVRDTIGVLPDLATSALHIRGGSLTLERVLIAGGEREGLLSEAATVRLSHVAFQRFAYAALRAHEGSVSGGPLDIRDSENGVHVSGAGARADLHDLTTRNLTAPPDTWSGLAALAEFGAQLTLTRARLERSQTVAVGVHEATATLRDLRVIDTQPGTIIGASFGYGLLVTGSGNATATRLVVSGSSLVGALAVGAGSRLVLEDALLEQTVSYGCPAEECPEFHPTGTGLGAYYGGTVVARRFVSRNNRLLGAQVDELSRLELSEGLITGNPIGVNVQRPGYDLSLLFDRVLYTNDVNLDATSLPLPPPPAAP